MPKPKRNIHAVAQETLTPPDVLAPNQTIGRVHTAAGNNLYQISLPDGSSILAELAARFRNTIWIKRGSYVLVDMGALGDRDNKLSGEIVNVIREEKTWRKMGYWPKEFGIERNRVGATGEESSSEEEDQGPRMPSSDEEEET